MAKTESTAVNQLIANIQGRPLERAMDRDDHDELSFEERTIPVHEPARRKPSPTSLAPQAAPPPPMPRTRSAAGTEIPALTSSARTTTTRPTTIPPLPPSHNPRATVAGVPAGPRSSTLPPPLRHSQPGVRTPDAQGTPAPELKTPSAPALPRPSSPNDAPAWLATPVPSVPPLPSLPSLPSLPPRRPPYPDATAPAQLVDGQDWFEKSSAVPSLDEAEIGTQGVRAKKSARLGLLVGTGLLLALVGVLVGGYLWFDREGGAKTAPPVGPVAAPAPAAGTAPAVEPAKTEPAAAAAAVEPAAATEPGAVAAAAAIEPAAATEPEAVAAAAAIEPEAAKAEPAAVAAVEPEKPEPSAAAVEPAKTEPAVAAADPAVVTPAVPTLVDVLFLSTPSGANVVLVDGGRTIPIGPTPVSASIDVSHSYEAVFALDGHQTLIKQLDPRRDRRFTVDLRSGKTKIKHGAPVLAKADAKTSEKSEKSERSAKAEKRAAEKAEKAARAEEKKAERAARKLAARAEKAEKSAARREKTSSKKVAAVDWTEEAKKLEGADPIGEPKKAEPVAARVEPKKAETGPKQQARDDEDPIGAPKATAPKAGAAPKVAAAPNAGGEGVLMVAAKPPCEIIIDGKSTGLTTPQRSIGLSAGTHKVTLVNKDAGIRKTIAVKVTAGKPTKLIQDYTSEMK
jgi:hypothetical protein